LRSPIRTPAAYATDNRLQEDGNNIVPLLKRIQNHYPLVYENTLKPLLAKINPHFREIGFEDLGAKSNLVLREHELAKRVSIEHISDGTLRFILLLGILYNPDRGSLICLDEPETGLHPDMIHTVAEGIQQAAREGTQMVVATHSPILLNSFRLDDLIVFDKNERNETQTSTPYENDFETWAEGFLPGKMWLQGIIGGRRWA
jgi:predicted ATPase